MGMPTTPSDSAPSYEDLFHNHPVNQTPPSGSSSSYAAVATAEPDVVEHSHSQTQLQDLSEPNAFKKHVHCELCDERDERRANRRKELQCCAMVAATFVAAFLIVFLIVEVVVTRHAH
ncbi:hypothetical protein MMC30_003357 [Trapelia coarctata]|nr:hypothetical protein [Trapelia coarctata]